MKSLTTTEAAQYLFEGIEGKELAARKRTLDAWRYQNKGPRYRKIGHFIRYTEADLREFVDTHARTGTSNSIPD